MTLHPFTAYAQNHRRQMCGRQAEAIAFSDAARRLQAAMDRPGDIGRLEDALRFNLRLWTIMQVEMSDAANPLPASLKRDMLNLAAFVDRQTAGTAGRDIQALVEINRNVAAGLMVAPETTEIR